MPRYRLVKTFTETNTIIVEAESADSALWMEEEGKFDKLWENADWNPVDDEFFIEDDLDDAELTEPCVAPSKEDVEKVMAYAKQNEG